MRDVQLALRRQQRRAARAEARHQPTVGFDIRTAARVGSRARAGHHGPVGAAGDAPAQG